MNPSYSAMGTPMWSLPATIGRSLPQPLQRMAQGALIHRHDQLTASRSPITSSARQPSDREITVKDNQKNVIAIPTAPEIFESPAPVVGLSLVRALRST